MYYSRKPRYPIDVWNVYEPTMNGEPRTNNQAELWHGQLKEAVRIQYPPFYTIAKELQKQHANSNVLRNQLITRMVFKKKKKEKDSC
uniref:Transposase n=1 Tax=Panagrolaimus davidi TaxID=227884 RepID=A0A914PP69_9BILA